ncbi:MAG TPA: arginine--tRNA ligase [Candidatus Paceibacterota bacterium]
MTSEIIHKQIVEALKRANLPESDFDVELARDFAHGDYASNVALIVGKSTAVEPLGIAEKLLPYLGNDGDGYIEKVEIAGPGFLNFWLSEKYHSNVLQKAAIDPTSPRLRGARWGWNDSLRGKKVMVEYTDPNVMKPFHIGHLMSNAIGESLSRLYEASGAQVSRTNYFSDVGLAIARAVWGMKEMKQTMPAETVDVRERTDFLGKAYAFGVKQAEEDESVMSEAKEINRQIYVKQEGEYLELYNIGRRWSLEHFDLLYKKLGSNFDHLIAESEVSKPGLEMSWQALKQGIFTESEGAVVFPEEKSGLHTRVFVTKEQLPTYEAKELALVGKKHELFPFDSSITITANEQNDYFKVVLKAVDIILPELAGKTRHVSHGMLRLPSGKMSSRTGNVITGEALINDVVLKAKEKNPDEKIAEGVAIGAIKYSILKQQPGKDIIFDFEKSLSLEGDSGPYLQYAYARARSVLEKSQSSNPKAQPNPNFQNLKLGEREKKLVRVIARFPEIIKNAQVHLAPQNICTYLIELASEFNSFYASNQIINPEDKETTQLRLVLTAAVAQTLSNGLYTLGIPVLEHM